MVPAQPGSAASAAASSGPLFSLATLAQVNVAGRITATTVVDLCSGPMFAALTPAAKCSGVQFEWWNNGATSRTLTGRLWDTSTVPFTLIASGTLTVTADGLFSITWPPVTLLAGRKYWVNVGPSDGSAVFSYFPWLLTVFNSGTSVPYIFGNVATVTMADFALGGTGAVSSNLGTSLYAGVWPLLTGV